MQRFNRLNISLADNLEDVYDPDEMNDLAEDPANNALKKELFEALVDLQASMGDTLQLKEQNFGF